MLTIEWTQECDICNGTGLKIGEKNFSNVAVVCYACDGSGSLHREFQVNEFTGRKERPNIIKVFARSGDVKLGPEIPGGVSYEEWKADPQAPFIAGRETRDHTCPAGWYKGEPEQPDWDQCFEYRDYWKIYDCPLYPNKAFCWDRWDKENALVLLYQGANRLRNESEGNRILQ